MPVSSVTLDAECEASEAMAPRAELVDAINLAVGEYALTLKRDDPLRDALRQVQGGLDAVSRAVVKGGGA